MTALHTLVLLCCRVHALHLRLPTSVLGIRVLGLLNTSLCARQPPSPRHTLFTLLSRLSSESSLSLDRSSFGNVAGPRYSYWVSSLIVGDGKDQIKLGRQHSS